MPIIIQPPTNFSHAGQLSSRFDQYDPRRENFDVDHIDIDLRDCQFIRPPAALWCVVYLTLAAKRGIRCRMLVPSGNMGVCIYLKSLGLFDILKQHGVEIDDRGIGGGDVQKTILPITHFQTISDVTNITNSAYDKLHNANFGASNLSAVVSELFSELAMNAVQHSESPVGAFACIQFFDFETGPRFICAVADGGIGVMAHLCRNAELRLRVSYDWDALELAIRERVSGTGDSHRGIGLYGVSEDVRRPHHSLLLHSGVGSLAISEELESSAKRTRLFPGTLAFLSIPT